MKSIFIVVCFLIINNISAAEFLIGPENPFKTPNELYLAVESGSVILSPGDTISIQSGVYRGTDVLAIWRTDGLLIRGIDGRADLYADGEYIIGKGIFVSKGNDIIYENIGFFDASVPDQNGAGIRLDGAGLTVRNCYFFNNENGILANNSENGEVLIEYSEFAVGGFGDGFSHNIYINHCAKLTIQYCYFHSASIGHQVKSRADQNLIQYNRIADLDGNSSRLIDLPNGGQSIIMGNEIIQGENAVNNNLIGYGLEGLSNPAPHNIKIVSNTILNYRASSCLFFHVDIGTDTFLVANNILGGSCTLFNEKEPTLMLNLINENIAEVEFLNPDSMNYGLFASSLAIDGGSELSPSSLVPVYEYQHPAGQKERRPLDEVDLGAHEAEIIINVSELQLKNAVYPNPASNELVLEQNYSGAYEIVNVSGRSLQKGSIYNNRISISKLPAGIYILRLENVKAIKFLKI